MYHELLVHAAGHSEVGLSELRVPVVLGVPGVPKIIDSSFNPIQGVPHLRGFHYRGFHFNNFWLMYAQVGNFGVSRGPPTVPLTRILHNAFFA